MANLFSMPSMTVGLMGRRPQNNNNLLQQLLSQSQAQFDAGGAYFTDPASRPAGNGVPVLENGSVGYVPPTQSAAPAQRDRVSGWRVLDRVLGGETVTGGLDSERARLQAQADAPQRMEVAAENERIARALGPQATLALRLNPQAFGESVGYAFRPQVVADGAFQSTPGSGQIIENPKEMEFGNKIVSVGRNGVQELAERGPNFAEQTAQDRLAWDRQYGAGQLGISAQNADTSRISALRPQIANTGQGGITTLINADSTIGQQIQGTPQRPPAAIETEGRISALRTDVTPTLGRMRSLLESGDVITGYAADNRLDAARALASLGNDKAKKEVAATEEYRNTAARLRVGMAKSLGANPSNADLAILEQVTGGNINQNRESLLATIGQGEQMTARQMQAAEQQLAQYGGGAQSGSIARPTSAAEYQALPSGTIFEAPDGSRRRKP